MSRLNIERQAQLEPTRIEYAISKIKELGYKIDETTNTSIKFKFKNSTVTLFPYSGWHTGKTIKDGIGLKKLLNQINKTE